MPAYDPEPESVDVPVLCGRAILLWDEEQPFTGSPVAPASKQFCMHRDGNWPHALSVVLTFAGAPGVFNVNLETADTDADEYYVTKASLSAVNADHIGRLEVANVVAKFGRLTMTACANAVDVTAQVY